MFFTIILYQVMRLAAKKQSPRHTRDTNPSPRSKDFSRYLKSEIQIIFTSLFAMNTAELL
jgi:hypothetical protein